MTATTTGDPPVPREELVQRRLPPRRRRYCTSPTGTRVSSPSSTRALRPGLVLEPVDRGLRPDPTSACSSYPTGWASAPVGRAGRFRRDPRPLPLTKGIAVVYEPDLRPSGPPTTTPTGGWSLDNRPSAGGRHGLIRPNSPYRDVRRFAGRSGSSATTSKASGRHDLWPGLCFAPTAAPNGSMREVGGEIRVRRPDRRPCGFAFQRTPSVGWPDSPQSHGPSPHPPGRANTRRRLTHVELAVQPPRRSSPQRLPQGVSTATPSGLVYSQAPWGR